MLDEGVEYTDSPYAAEPHKEEYAGPECNFIQHSCHEENHSGQSNKKDEVLSM